MDFKRILITLLIISSGFFYYQLSKDYVNYGTDTEIIKQNISVKRIIDGDTIDTSIGKIRLLGINTPEESMPFYTEAQEFLSGLIFNKTTELQTIKGNEKDQYNRTLGYIFLGDLFINTEIIENGLATFYSYEEDLYTDKLKESEERARQEGKGIWEKEENYGCLELIELKYEEETRCNNEEKLVLENNCGKELNIILKDDATHIYKETIGNRLWEMNFSCTFNNAGDSIYIWNENNGKLVLFYRY